ncbi:MAG: transketolase [Bacteroidetes bacterium HGW-Bacteroidetes-21]|nr:MAG: transketolase [Bacteroidetes bacterium HGW-Bacteroidetes-21]
MNKICDVAKLSEIARNIRIDIIRSLAQAGSGHLGGSLDLADIFTVLYFNEMNFDPSQLNNENRDRLILSIGHVAPVLYTTLAHAGFFPVEELATLRKMGSRLQGHPCKETGLPGIEASTGSLGQGLSLATGLALAAQHDNLSHRTYCILGDGELQEGQIWEAAMSAAHYNLNNLTAIVDRNHCQIDGYTHQVMNLDPLYKKWSSFGWKVIMCDGNDFHEILKAFYIARQSSNQPSVIIAQTTMSKGVPSIENDYTWHGKAPSPEQAREFIAEIMNVR